jgi:hypothetical protein
MAKARPPDALAAPRQAHFAFVYDVVSDGGGCSCRPTRRSERVLGRHLAAPQAHDRLSKWPGRETVTAGSQPWAGSPAPATKRRDRRSLRAARRRVGRTHADAPPDDAVQPGSTYAEPPLQNANGISIFVRFR